MKITINGMEFTVRGVSGAKAPKAPKPELTREEVLTARREAVELTRDASGQLFANTPGTGRSYRVYSRNGIMRCECPSFMFQRGQLTQKTCKHLDAAFEREERPAEWAPPAKKAKKSKRAS